MKLTPARERRIVEAARLGAHREQAAAAGGVSRSTLQRWLREGEADDAPERLQKFVKAVHGAETEAELEALRAIERAAADGDWRAMVWRLERRWPERWGRTTRHELTGRDGEAIAVREEGGWDLRKLSDEEVELLEELRRKATPDG
jgi:hypothetical protein